MDLWTELQRVRRQLVQHREQTEHDLENQRNEFTRVIRNVGGLTRQLNLVGVEVINDFEIVIEIFKFVKLFGKKLKSFPFV